MRWSEHMSEDRIFNCSHYLMGVRLDNWFRLLGRAGWKLDPQRLPQALLITATSLALSPFALLERIACALPVAATKVEKDPVFILGHWRSGTTYLQNLMSRDPQFGWADPVGTCTFSNSVLLGRLLRAGVGGSLKNARPMDNVRYTLDLPMEETFAVANVTPYSIDHMLAFPSHYKSFIPYAFVEDLPAGERRRWRRSYALVVKKLTMLHGGRQMLFKSPDNTARVPELVRLYPDAKFVNIHRDPYATIQSTIHMFNAQMNMLRLSAMPDIDMDEGLEDVVIGIFERMYKELFALEPDFRPGHYVSVSYEQFTRDPEAGLRGIYNALGLNGFEKALPYFRRFISSQKDYRKNRFEISNRLRTKINDRLGFYFEHCGYEKITEETV